MSRYSSLMAACLSALACLLVPARSTAEDCLPSPSKLGGWWAGENSASDNTGHTPGYLAGSISYTPAQVGAGFLFPGDTPGLRVPASAAIDVGRGEGFTLELWISPVSGEDSYPLLEWASSTSYGVHFWIGSRLYANVVETNGASHIVETTNGLVQPGVFQHVALTYSSDGGRIRLYYNGSMVQEALTTPFVPETSADLLIGFRTAEIPYGPAYFAGIIDEPSIYSRELSPAEIASIHAAGTAGKCYQEGPAVFLIPPSTSYVDWEDANLTMTAIGVGTPPLRYQWYYSEQPIPGATSDTLTLTNIAAKQAGPYSVKVSNDLGFRTAQTYLTVKSPPACTNPPDGLISLWRGDHNNHDAVGNNHGPAALNYSYGEGKVRLCFSFDGLANQAVSIFNSPNLNPRSSLSLECWVNPAQVGLGNLPIVTKDDGFSGRQYGVSMIQEEGQSFFQATIQTNGGPILLTCRNPVIPNTWYHLVVTYDGAEAVFFVNGEPVSEATASGLIATGVNALFIGGDLGNGQWNGLIDEVALYGRALSAQEVREQFISDSGGKCKIAVAPIILSDPTNSAIALTKPFTVDVVCGGTEPLFYQWLKEGAVLPGATNAFFRKNVGLSDSGSYSVVVSNSAGSVISKPATLAISGPPVVSMTSTSVPLGSVLVLPINLLTLGDEIACSFSIQFDPLKFRFLEAAAGTTNGAILMVNSSLSGNGRVGFALAAPGDTTFGILTNTINVYLLATNISTAGSVSFSDNPTIRQAIYSDFRVGSVTSSSAASIQILSTNLEADVFPATPDRSLTASDWLKVGRHVVGLEVPATEAVFQAVDCAPRASKGDGRLAVSDWVQSYRYVFGYDLSTAVSGPLKTEPALASTETNRQIRVRGIQIPPTAEEDLPITVLATGDENALGFSLHFDPATVRFISAGLGVDASGSYSILNTNGLAEGKLGALIALPAETHLAPGERQVFIIRFKNTQTNAVVIQPQFASVPILVEASSWEGSPLSLVKVSLPAPILTPPQLQIERLADALHLIWPVSAADYVLQESWTIYSTQQWSNTEQAPEISGTSFKLILPQPSTNSTRFFRLHRR